MAFADIAAERGHRGGAERLDLVRGDQRVDRRRAGDGAGGLGIRWNPLRCAHEVPDESTLRVLLEALDATAFAAACGSWLDLTDAVVTVDALHTQHEHAIFLVEEKNAHYILVVKKNQPTLYRQLKGLLWRKVPIAHREEHHGHGRSERRQLKVLTVAAGLAFPHAAQAIAIIRKTRPRHGGRWKSVTVYALTSLATHQASPADLASWIRAHWHIEALHHIRDVTYREDASLIRTGNGPAVMAALRTMAIGILKLHGWTNIAKANRHHAHQAQRCMVSLGIT